MTIVHTMKRTAHATLLVLSATFASSTASADLVSQYAADVSQTSYTNFVDQSLYAHYGNSRKFASGVNRIAARDNIRNHFDSIGLQDSLESFTYQSLTGWNIVGTLPGRVTPERVYLVGAHWDSANHNGGGSGANAGAPGGDDNASGVAGIMEAARVLAPHAFESTIVFVAFDAEEVGLIGSKRYVAAHPTVDYRAAISMDMIAYNPAADHDRANLYYKYASTGLGLANDMGAAFAQHTDIDGVVAKYDTYDMTDHAPFANAGFPALAVSEFNVWNNPRYHRWDDSIDTPGYLDMAYATDITRGVTAYLATAAGALQVGDTDLDDDVDFADLLKLAQSYGSTGATWQTGDFNADGAVNFSDLLQLAQHYGTGTSDRTADDFADDWALAQALAPEPTGVVAGALFGLLGRRRTRRSLKPE